MRAGCSRSARDAASSGAASTAAAARDAWRQLAASPGRWTRITGCRKFEFTPGPSADSKSGGLSFCGSKAPAPGPGGWIQYVRGRTVENKGAVRAAPHLRVECVRARPREALAVLHAQRHVPAPAATLGEQAVDEVRGHLRFRNDCSEMMRATLWPAVCVRRVCGGRYHLRIAARAHAPMQ